VQEKKKIQVFEEDAEKEVIQKNTVPNKKNAFDSDSSDEELTFERPADVPRLTIEPKELENLIIMTTL